MFNLVNDYFDDQGFIRFDPPILTPTSCEGTSNLFSTPYFDETIKIIQENQLANIGIHINLTEGKPLLKNHTTIVDKKGYFIRNLHTLEHIDMKEVHDEIEAQIEKALATGVSINHMDTHHHIHATSKFRKVFISFSNRYQLPLRKINNTVINPIKVLKFYLDTKQAKYYTSHFLAGFFAMFLFKNITRGLYLPLINGLRK